MWEIARACTITRANQEKVGLGERSKACPEVNLRVLSSDVLSGLAHSLKAQGKDICIVACIPIFNIFILIKIKTKQDKIEIHESIQISHAFCLDRVSQTTQNITTLY